MSNLGLSSSAPINEGGQAVIGNVRAQESGRAQSPDPRMPDDPDEGAA